MKKFIVSILAFAIAASLFMMLTDYDLFEPSATVTPDDYQPVDITFVDNNQRDDFVDDLTETPDPISTPDETDEPEEVDEPVIEYFGEITLQVVDENEEVVINQTLGFFEGDDDLIALMKTEFPVYCGNTNYELDESCETSLLLGRIVLGIDNVITDWYNSFLAIYVNDQYSHVGIDGIEFVDGDVIKFIYTSFG